MSFSKTFIILQLLLEYILIIKAQGVHSPLTKICYENSKDVCVGIFVKSRWILASSLCKHIRYKKAKVIMGSLQRDCVTGEANKITRVYELKKIKNILLLKVDKPFETTFASSSMEKNFEQASCETYCLQDANGICGNKIDPILTTVVPCSDRFKDKVCLKTNNDSIINNLDGSPMLCNETMVGFANLMSSKNLLTLVSLPKFYNEIKEIIRTDAKIRSPKSYYATGEKEIEVTDQKPHRSIRSILPQKNKRKGKGKGKGKKEGPNIYAQMDKQLLASLFEKLQLILSNFIKNRLSSLGAVGEEFTKRVMDKVNDFVTDTLRNAGAAATSEKKKRSRHNSDDDDDDDEDLRRRSKHIKNKSNKRSNN